MGQGTDSCGGYEVDYDPYYEGLVDGRWYQQVGGFIHVSKMTKSHLQNTIRMVANLQVSANYSCDADKWQDWHDLLTDELARRPAKSPAKSPTKSGSKSYQRRGATRQMKCHCGTEYAARIADLNRGWGLSCNKRCAAIRREFGRPAATPINLEISL